nr:hypothetical protein [uncultured Cohaesibacter sp.]
MENPRFIGVKSGANGSMWSGFLRLYLEDGTAQIATQAREGGGANRRA